MTRQIFGALGVTLAFAVGAICTALILDIPSVQAYLGLAGREITDWSEVSTTYFGTALLSGLLVDALRFLGTKWGGERS